VLTVDNLHDPASSGACSDAVTNDCSLRQAVTNANDNTGETDYIHFQAGLTGTLTLTSAAGGEIPITDGVYIYGNGPDHDTIAAAPNSRIFNVNPATAGDDVGIYSIELTGGNVQGSNIAGSGGAISNWDGVLHVSNALLTGNTAQSTGGAIYDRGYHAQPNTFTYSTFTDNYGGKGGAIENPNNFGVIAASTIAGNTAYEAGAVYGSGYILDSTITGNHRVDPSGSGDAAIAGGHIGLYNTIVADNTAPTQQLSPDLSAHYTYAVTSLVQDPRMATGIINGPENIFYADPQLGVLGMNGGDLPTMKPAASSPVVDQGFSDAQVDQRGLPRLVDNPNVANVPGGNGADIGAVELTLTEGPQGVVAPVTPQKTKKKKQCKKRKKHKRSAETAKKKCKKKKKRRSGLAAARFRFQMARAAASRWPGGAEHHPFRLDR
jgi:hypothetical protein